jgi:S-adenosylmethionine:tRNA ribosyltransferase-isomerase
LIGGGKLTILRKLEWGEIEIKFDIEGSIIEFLDQYGEIPLPPYMKRQAELSDETDYQTIYNKISGSVAAPTAGLHFTEELLTKIQAAGIELCFITLHVGAGTFLPIKNDNIFEHKMHSENFHISIDAACKINTAKKAGRRIISVGSTSLRALESAYKNGEVLPGTYDTNIFITPGFKFNVIDTIITNLHLPKSTLLLLVSAFVGRDKIMKAYKYAVDNKLRFFSYGDVMILDKVDLSNQKINNIEDEKI